MQTIAAHLDTAFRAAIRAAFDLDADPLIAVAGNDKFGDYQSNAAMGLSKELSARGQKTNPRAVAEQIKAHLQLGDVASEVGIAGPGFINVRLSPAWLEKQLGMIAGDERLGIDPAARPKTVVVDYSGPNVAKEMHVGHLRSSIIGDALSRVIEFQGHEVIRQNHIGDWGTQFGMLIAYLGETGARHADSHIADLEGFYRDAKKRFDEDAEFQKKARQTVVELQSGSPPVLAAWQKIVDETRRSYLPIYERLGVKLRVEHERGESFYNPFLAEVVRELKEKGLAVLSEGATVVPVEGFEAPLIIEKTGGGYLYATTDLAGVRFRVRELRANRIIYTHDSRQAQHFAQVFATAKKAGWADGVDLEYAPFGTMLGPDGKPFKTRSGGTVKLKELLDEAEEKAFELVSMRDELPEAQRKAIAAAVGIGGVKYADLSKDRTSDYLFSWETMLNLQGNSAPYLQYAHARIKSIFRKAAAQGIEPKGHAIALGTPHELALAKHLLRLGEVIEVVSRELKPHHLTTYLYELAVRFSGFFENCPVIQSDEPLRSSRLALCDITARSMALGLDLLGIAHPEQM
jgi:arginyl-tRNA synthetase